jgi:hypothetical protein
MASIEIRGVQEIVEKLGAAAAFQTLRAPMQRSVFRLEAGMKKYPPQRAGTSYRRTGTLGRRWTSAITQSANELEGKIGNATSYGPFVQSQMFQAATHRGIWQTDQEIATRETPFIVADFDQAIQEALD